MGLEVKESYWGKLLRENEREEAGCAVRLQHRPTSVEKRGRWN